MTAMEVRKRENKWVWMEIRGSYIYIKYKPNKQLKLEEAKQIIEDAVDFAATENKYFPVLTDIKDMPPHGKDVRDYFATKGGEKVIANAILVTSSINSILANFFFTLHKPKIPTRIFTDQAKALKWLEMFPAKTKSALV